MNHGGSVQEKSLVPGARAGGIALILAAILFMAVFSYLAATFDYPDVLDRPAAEVLPRLIALGTSGRAVWALYALIPLLLIPAGVGAEAALAKHSPGAVRNATLFATISGLTMLLGLARWPTIMWELGRAWPDASPEQQASLATVFAGLNSYLGNFLGEFVGEFGLNLFFALTAWAMLADQSRPRWMGITGMVVSVIGFVAMFRNVTPSVGPIAEANNLVLPVWLVVFGVLLLRSRVSQSHD